MFRCAKAYVAGVAREREYCEACIRLCSADRAEQPVRHCKAWGNYSTGGGGSFLYLITKVSELAVGGDLRLVNADDLHDFHGGGLGRPGYALLGLGGHR